MIRMTNRSQLARDKRHIRRLPQGVTLEGQVSPCVYMYPGYPFQLMVKLRLPNHKPGGEVFLIERHLSAETATDADVARMMDRIKTIPCKRCSAVAFDPATVPTNRDGLCERCFLRELEDHIKAEQEAESHRLSEHDSAMRSQGMKYRITAWIHPEEKDDYLVHWYFASRPTKAVVRRRIVEEGSTILDDFKFVSLASNRKKVKADVR